MLSQSSSRLQSEIAHRHRVQRHALPRIELLVAAVDARRRRDAPEVARAPLAHRGQLVVRIAAPGVEIKRGVEQELAADQAARVIARRIVVVRAQVVGRAGAQVAPRAMSNRSISVPPALVAVPHHDDRIAVDEHLVVPGVCAGSSSGAAPIDHRHRPSCWPIGQIDREQPPAPQHHQAIAMRLYDSALVDAGVLHIGHGFRRRGRRRR